jgi:hypothetical protein
VEPPIFISDAKRATKLLKQRSRVSSDPKKQKPKMKSSEPITVNGEDAVTMKNSEMEKFFTG